MAIETVAALLADLLGDVSPALPTANPAKAANGEALCGVTADSHAAKGCEGLRRPLRDDAAPDKDSQVFAGVRIVPNGPDSEHWRGSSQLSQDSQANTATHHAAVTGGKVGRLVPAANDTAAAAPVQAMSRRGGRHALTPAEAGRCHAQPWGDLACARFVVRVTRLLRLGVPAGDADDLAERLHLRDFEGDDRRACVECDGLAGHASSGWRCRRAALAGCGVQLAPDLVTRLQRCPGHTPVA